MNLQTLIRSALLVITSLSSQAAPAQQREDFIKIEATDMKSGLAEAVRAAKGAHAEGGFWVAYPLPVRQDVVIDPDKGEFVGDADDIHRLPIFIGRASNSPGGTRNAGVFMLYGPGGASVTRVEVYNLDRAGKYRGLPVYWLGKPAASESLGLLRAIIDANPGTDVAENATLALALHDDPAVRGALEDVALNSRDDRARKTALHWLGFTGGENELLARLVADDGQSVRVRGAAARALGAGSPAVSVSTLKGLYTSVVEVEVRRALLYSISINPDQRASSDFLREVAQHDFDNEARRQAAYWRSEKGEGKQ
jgi:hypothetical protein